MGLGMVDAKRCGGSGWGRDRENGLAEGREAFDGLTVKWILSLQFQ
jgi:hypothetical protein